jgi:hypothetical protein
MRRVKEKEREQRRIHGKRKTFLVSGIVPLLLQD